MSKIELTIVGVVADIQEEQLLGNSRLRRCIVVLEDKGYHNYIPIDFWNDRIKYLDNIGIGEEARFRCTLSGKEVTTSDGRKFYPISLYCWGAKSMDEPTTDGKPAETGQRLNKTEKEATNKFLEGLDEDGRTLTKKTGEILPAHDGVVDDLPF